MPYKGGSVDHEDVELFEKEVEDFKIFNRRIPTFEEEAALWERIQQIRETAKLEKDSPTHEDVQNPH
jgi:hypothetical protein